MKLIVCETVAAITPHLRVVTVNHPENYHGHATPKPKALCGAFVAWDTKLTLEAARCASCILVASQLEKN